MFKDKYKKANENINPSPEFIESLKKELNTKQIRPPRPVKKPKRKIAISAIAAVASFAVLLTAVITLTNRNFSTFNNRPTVKVADDYSQVYSILTNLNKKGNSQDKVTNGDRIELSEGAPEYDYAGDAGASSDKKYSETNVQVEGVDEEDIVKTDGEYIYIINNSSNNHKLVIIKADAENTKIISKTELNSDKLAIGMYVHGNNIAIIYREKDSAYYYSGNADMLYNQEGNTYTEVYNISDKSSPVLINTLGQSGSYCSSRMIGNKIYIITNKYIYSQNLKEGDPADYIPLLYNGTTAETIPVKDICIAPNVDQSSYTILTSFNIQSPQDFISQKSVLGSSDQIYCSTENAYIVKPIYNKYRNKSDILKFNFKDGNIEFAAQGNVDGTPLNQFSMDEYNGNFRIVTTISTWSNISSNQSNSLYVLDSTLKTIGSVENLAKDESVKSVRFDGDIAYFVTFRQTDPLFTVDLSTPESPNVLSALKIPGFSSYLHKWSDTLLFGFGFDADEKTGQTNELKLSMFDISDKTDVREISKTLVDNYYYSNATYNHHEMFISPERNLLGFMATGYRGNFAYFVYNYNQELKTFELVKSYDFKDSFTTRGLFINDTFYIINLNTASFDVCIFDMEDFNKTTQITIN